MFKASLIIFLALGTGYASTGLIYLSADQFMSYHADAIRTEWSALNADYQGLLLGLVKGLGAGALLTGFALAFMAVQSFRDSSQTYLVLLPATSIGYSSLLCYATFTVYTHTPGQPPLALNIFSVTAAIAASALLLWSHRPAKGRAWTNDP